MVPGSCTRRNPCNNPLAHLTREQDELASPQGPTERSDAGSDKAPTSPETLIPTLVPPTKDFFTKFIKAFVESIQARDREQAEPQE